MKIEGQRPLRHTASVRAKAAYSGPSNRTAAAWSAGGVQDTASVMGIPEDELTPKVREAIGALLEEVHLLRTELDGMRNQLAEAQGLADQDPLLPMYNRRAFMREISRIMAFSQRYKAKAALIYFDLNGFKTINDRHGHAAGDQVLRNVGELLIRNVRSSDVIGRIGGDEFGVLLARASADVARQKAENLSKMIAESVTEWDGDALSVSASFGVYVIEGETDPDTALKEADREMYTDKRESQRNR